MIRFASSFPLAETATPRDVLQVARNWPCGSHHHPWKIDDLPNNGDAEQTSVVKKYGQEIQYGVVRTPGDVYSAFRHKWTEAGQREWVTDLVACFSEHSAAVVSIRLSCASVLGGVQMPLTKKPVIVNQLLSKIGAGTDGELDVSDSPIKLHESQVDLAAKIVRGETVCALPVVYVSSSHGSLSYANADDLARRLAGMAHVVEEPSRRFSFDVKEATGGRNTYGGAVGLYWMEGAGVHKRFLPTEHRQGELEDAVFDEIWRISCEARPEQQVTWSAVESAESANRLRKLELSRSEQGGAEPEGLAEWIEEFDKRDERNKQELEAANNEIGRLNAALRISRADSALGSGLLQRGNERPLFEGELREVVVEALEQAKAVSGAGTRKNDILTDLLEANPVDGKRKLMVGKIKSCLQNAIEIGSRELGELESLGFQTSSEGKHHKIVFEDDARYTFALHKTASDHRTPRNLVSEIASKLFK